MRPTPKLLALAAALAVPLLAATVATPQVASATDPGTIVSFWAGEEMEGGLWDDVEDYWEPRELSVFTPALWDVLERNRTPVYFNLRYKRDYGPVPAGRGPYNEVLPIFKEAKKRGVPIGAWITVPPSDGYFAHEGGAAIQKEAIIAARAWAAEYSVGIADYVLDIEPPIEVVLKLREIQAGNFGALADLYAKTIDPAKNCRGWHDYKALYAWAKTEGLPLSASVPPIPIDDNADGTMALQDATDMSIPSGTFDKLYPQAYRNELDMFGDPGPSIITSYWNSSRQQFGSIAEITIGTPGQTGYPTAADMVKDVRLLATLGATNVPIYTLELAAKTYGPAGVEQIIKGTAPFTGFEAWWARNYISPAAVAQRGVLSTLDVSATAATPVVTTQRGEPQLPRTFAEGVLGC